MEKLDDDTNRSKFSSMEKSNLLSEYINQNLLAFKYLRNRNYKIAMTSFEKSIEIAKDLDEIKHVESLTNYGVSQYFCGKFTDSYLSLDKAREISNRLIENYVNDKSILMLHLRVISNLSLTALTLNKLPECRTFFNFCLELIKEQPDIYEKIKMLKECVYIFFRIDSLGQYFDQKEKEKEKEKDNAVNELTLKRNKTKQVQTDFLTTEAEPSIINPKTISKALFSLHKTLREGNIEHWLKAINEEAKNPNNLKDKNGYVFVLLNALAANVYQGAKIEDVKLTFAKVMKSYAEQYQKEFKLKENNLGAILNDMKSRMDMAMEMYRKFLELEEELNKISNQIEMDSLYANKENNIKSKYDEASSNKVFVRLFFKHALNYLNKTSTKVYSKNNLEPVQEQFLENKENKENLGMTNTNLDAKSRIELALKLLENNEFDFSQIDLFHINSEIIKSLKILIENLIIIRNKNILYLFFKRYMKNTLKYESYKQYMKERFIISQKFIEDKQNVIFNGCEIVKINHTSSGVKSHFYRVDENKMCIQIFKSLKAFETIAIPMNEIYIKDIFQISYGILSRNLIKRSKYLAETHLIKNRKQFLSLIMEKKTIDFYFESEELLNDWIYGLITYIKKKNLKTSIFSVSGFILTRLKYNLIMRLQEMKNDMRFGNKSISILEELHSYFTTNSFGLYSFSFTKILLLYKKIMEKSPVLIN